MRHRFDGHAIAGILGTSVSVVLQNFSTVAAGAAATVTAVYMAVRCVREWRKMKRDASTDSGPLCENFAPKKNVKL